MRSVKVTRPGDRSVADHLADMEGWLERAGIRGTELRPAIKVSRIPWRNRSRIGTGHFAMSRLRDQPFVIRQGVDVDLALWKWKFRDAFTVRQDDRFRTAIVGQGEKIVKIGTVEKCRHAKCSRIT